MARLQRRNRIKGKQAFSSILPLRGELQCQSKTLRFFACSKSTGILILITTQNQQISNERWNEQEHSYCASLADAAQSKANKPFAAALSGYFQCSMKVGHNGNR